MKYILGAPASLAELYVLEEDSSLMNPTLGIGIIGAGGIMGHHAIAYRCLSKLARLVAVADIDETRASKAKKEHGFVESYSDYRRLLDRIDVDVVSICTRPNSHASIVIDALSAGKHVLCEKPMACTLEEADRTIEMADRYQRLKLSYVYQNRSDPVYLRIRELVQNRELGRILMATMHVNDHAPESYYSADCDRGSWRVDAGGVLISRGIHQLDALIYLLGAPVETSAEMQTFLKPTDAEDTLVGWIKFDSGALASLECTVCAHQREVEVAIFGENAETFVRTSSNAYGRTWGLMSKSSAVERALQAKALRAHPDTRKRSHRFITLSEKLVCHMLGRKWLPSVNWGHTPYIRQFLESILLAYPVPVSAREARRSLELATGLYEAALSHRLVRFPIDHDLTCYRSTPEDRYHLSSRVAQLREV